MDDTDRKLMLLIGAEPRIHLRELARRLGISRQAVYHRVQVLTGLGVIKHAIAGISLAYLDAVPMCVCGRSRTASVETTLNKLGESELTRRVVVAGGNYIYVVGYLREVSELESYVDFVKRAAEMSEPIVGIYCHDEELMRGYTVDGAGRWKKSYKVLSPLDLQIIASLKDDARRPVAVIADMVGVSAKTVRRHLEAMMDEGSLDMSVPMDSTLGGDLFLIMHVNLTDGADRREVGKRLISKCGFSDQYIRTFSNLPSLLVWAFWSDKMTEIRNALKEASEDEDVLSAMLNFAYYERIYRTWRDDLPAIRTTHCRKTRTLEAHSGRKNPR